MDWLPIELAPKDGTKLLFGYAGMTFNNLGYWEPQWFWGPSWVDGMHAVKPTHFMPIPANPPLVKQSL